MIIHWHTGPHGAQATLGIATFVSFGSITSEAALAVSNAPTLVTCYFEPSAGNASFEPGTIVTERF